MTFRIEPFNRQYNYKTFSCGEEALDRYFHEQVTQDIKRRISTCFVALEKDNVVAGYYTLSSASIPLNALPPDTIKKLPRYPVIPTLRIGRLAVDTKFHRHGLGAAMLIDAMRRALRSEAGTFAMLVDAKNDAAVSFYEHHGFLKLESLPRSLFLPLAVAEKLAV